ncbi:hypothetical protein JL720_11465 [Aureococcus anophagefferens]|nr:hypothetical protein JL720_11465 [Aureococcus anophagefferens]
MSDPGAEKELDTLRKLPENKQCANCGVVAQHGHGAVVMTYATFVCHTCKSSHQSFSHLCKSVSMSYWSAKEVKKLRDGGNARCRAVFMGKMDPSRGLKPGASLQATKGFVDLVYNKRAFFESRPSASFAIFDDFAAAPPGGGAAAPAGRPTRDRGASGASGGGGGAGPLGAPVSPAAGFGAFAAAPARPPRRPPPGFGVSGSAGAARRAARRRQPAMARAPSAPAYGGQAGWPQQPWQQPPPAFAPPNAGTSPAMKPNAMNAGASNIAGMFPF